MILDYLGVPGVITRVLKSARGRCDYGRKAQRDEMFALKGGEREPGAKEASISWNRLSPRFL